jgi:hypothetical protein
VVINYVSTVSQINLLESSDYEQLTIHRPLLSVQKIESYLGDRMIFLEKVLVKWVMFRIK